MKRIIVAALAGIALMAGTQTALTAEPAKAKTGEELFKEHCALCHPDGGNIVNEKKTLKKADREKNGVKSAADIVKLMRNPGPGMQKFDKGTLADKDAHLIADYIIKTFK